MDDPTRERWGKEASAAEYGMLIEGLAVAAMRGDIPVTADEHAKLRDGLRAMEDPPTSWTQSSR